MGDPETLTSKTALAPLRERYEVLDQIGAGGMGTVWKGKQIATGRAVAIKLLSTEYVGNEVRRTRFEHEAKAASALYHPNLVSIMDFGCDEDGTPYLVLEYIPGIGLDQIIATKKRLDPHELIEIFCQICKGLSHVHHKGIIHRDLKPSNIMVVKEESGDMQVKIVDFGIAKHDRTQAITQTGELLGSPLYMSPEQALGQPVDPRSDIYSVGCMLYEAAVGKPPFVGENSITTLVMRLNHEPEPFNKAAPFACLSEELEKVIMRALKRNPQDRYQTIAALQADLRNLDGQHPKPSGTIQGLKTLRSQNAETPPAQTFSDKPRWLETAALMTVILTIAGMAVGFLSMFFQNASKLPGQRSAPPAVAQAPTPAPAAPAKPPEPKVIIKYIEKKVPVAPPKPTKIIPLPADIQEDIANNKKPQVIIRYIERPPAQQPAQQPAPVAPVQATAPPAQTPPQQQQVRDPRKLSLSPEAAQRFNELCKLSHQAGTRGDAQVSIANMEGALQILQQNGMERTIPGANLHNILSSMYLAMNDRASAQRHANAFESIREEIKRLGPPLLR